MNRSTRFRHANGGEVVDSFALPQAADDHGLFIQTVARNDDRDWLADSFGDGVLEHSFGGGVPRGDDPVDSLADDGVFRRIDNGGEQRMGLLIAAPLGDVSEDENGSK